MDSSAIAAYFGHDKGMNHDAIDVKPIDFDFFNQPVDLDGDGEGRWYVERIPEVDEAIEDLEAFELQDEAVHIEIAAPDSDGDIEITITDQSDAGTAGWLSKAIALASAHGIALPIEADDADDETEHVISVRYNTDAGSKILSEHFELDPALFDAREPSDFDPVMNYAYPIPGLSAPDDWFIRVSSTTIVHIDGNPHLALTGGGMDLSWEIAESYLVLGYWPPVHFARLPRMAGRGESERDRMILEACAYSCRTMAGWCGSRLVEIEAMLASDAAA